MRVCSVGHVGWQRGHTEDVEVNRLRNILIDSSEGVGVQTQELRERLGVDKRWAKVSYPIGEVRHG